VALGSFCIVTSALAQSGSSNDFHRYYAKLIEHRLLAKDEATLEDYRALLRQASELYGNREYAQSTLLLFELLENPSYVDVGDEQDRAQAEFLLSSGLYNLGAYFLAEDYAVRLLNRGPTHTYFGPTYRKLVDIVLELYRGAKARAQLDHVRLSALPLDARDEHAYVEGRSAEEEGKEDEAQRAFRRVSDKSRFYVSAQYYLGALEARRKNYRKAERHFCAVVKPAAGRHALTIDHRYFDVRDLSWLALGRVAHESGRGDDAFYYYFQVPQDSDRLADAFFEGAYSMYEAHDHDAAMDLLDQLEARFPNSAQADEALLLRGYLHLARCEFEEARRLFTDFETRFGPLRSLLDSIIARSDFRQRLYQRLVDKASQTQDHSKSSAYPMLISLLRVNPEFYKVHTQLTSLNAEHARFAWTARYLNQWAGKVRKGDRPLPVSVNDDQVTLPGLYDKLATARAALNAIEVQLRSIKTSAGSDADVKRAWKTHVQLKQKIHDLSLQLTALEQPPAQLANTADDLDALLARDVEHARTWPVALATLRQKLLDAADQLAEEALLDLRKRLGEDLRRARIGQIDAVMGSKRRIEKQIESLAQGRYPAEFVDPLREQGLLRDDEEYWPYDGEYWEDEFVQGSKSHAKSQKRVK